MTKLAQWWCGLMTGHDRMLGYQPLLHLHCPSCGWQSFKAWDGRERIAYVWKVLKSTVKRTA